MAKLPATHAVDVPLKAVRRRVAVVEGGLRALCEVQGVPFSVWSAEEGEGFLRRWAAVLNALKPAGVQFVARSRDGALREAVASRREDARAHPLAPYREMGLAAANHLEALMQAGDARSLDFFLVVPGKTEAQIDASVASYANVFGRIGLGLRRLEEPELSLRLASIVRPDVPAHWYSPEPGAGHERFLAQKPLERIAPEWATRTRDVYTVQGVYTRSLLIGDAPPTVGTGWLAPFLLSPGDVTVSLGVVPIPPGETNRILRLRRTQYLTDMQQRLKMGRMDDPEEALALQSATMVEAQVKSGAARLFRTGIVLTLRAPTVAALAELERGIRDQLDTANATTWPLTFEHPQGFRESLPLFVNKLGREQVFDTTSLAHSFFYDASNVGMPAGPVWGYTTRGRRPVLYDLRNRLLGLANPHAAIIGPSGVGKSITAAAILVESMVGPKESRPDQTFIIDPKLDYDKLRQYFGGTSIRWEVGHPPHVINAMHLYPDRHLDMQMQDVLGLIALATTTETDPMSVDDYAFWELALRHTYARFDILRDAPETWLHLGSGARRTPTDYPTLRDLAVTIGPGGQMDKPTMATRLSSWATGIYAGIFARHTTANLSDEAVVVFDLEALTHADDALKRLRPMATYLISLFVWGEARTTYKKRTLVTDEVATLLSRPATANFFGQLLSLGRSKGMSVIHMTQQYVDYTKSEDGRRAITSTATKLLLQQVGGENLDELTRDFQLTAHLRDFVLKARIGTPGEWGSEALMVTPRGMETIEILPPAEVLELMRPPGALSVLEQAARAAGATGARDA